MKRLIIATLLTASIPAMATENNSKTSECDAIYDLAKSVMVLRVQGTSKESLMVDQPVLVMGMVIQAFKVPVPDSMDAKANAVIDFGNSWKQTCLNKL